MDFEKIKEEAKKVKFFLKKFDINPNQSILIEG